MRSVGSVRPGVRKPSLVDDRLDHGEHAEEDSETIPGK